MPTDGADFGRTKSCYGKMYTALRVGAENTHVADLAVWGVERDIRRDGGAPVFREAVEALVTAAQQGGVAQLFNTVDSLSRRFGDSALSRNILGAAEKVGMAALNSGGPVSQVEAAEKMLCLFAVGRCEGTSAYVTRHRTHSATETALLLADVARKIASSPSLSDLAARMLNGSERGLPARAPSAEKIDHSKEGLNSFSLERGL